jgi:urease accessory protein
MQKGLGARLPMSLQGHLDLLAGAGDHGRTVLRRQSFAAPIHISKPHHDAGWLVVNLASPSPGLLSGDRVDMRVELETGAKVLLTAPSANRIHAMQDGHAELSQTFRVASGAFLDVWPEYLIPQAGACYRQRTRIEVAAGGSLLWTESVAPGRTAHGEVFAFKELRLSTDILHGPARLVRERYRIVPANASVASLCRVFPGAYYASVVCIADTLREDDKCWEAIRGLHDSASALVGTSRLGSGAFTVKIVAADSPSLRIVTAAIRGELQRALYLEVPSTRRVTGEPLRESRLPVPA